MWTLIGRAFMNIFQREDSTFFFMRVFVKYTNPIINLFKFITPSFLFGGFIALYVAWFFYLFRFYAMPYLLGYDVWGMLAFPLEIVNNEKDILKDLKYYESKIAVEGPAMSHSILAVLYARLGEPDKAFKLFKKAYVPNKREPFGSLSESATSNNPYFATGAGGMLQTILFGFGGLHITNEGVIQMNPVLPSNWKSLTIKGIGKDKNTYKVNHL